MPRQSLLHHPANTGQLSSAGLHDTPLQDGELILERTSVRHAYLRRARHWIANRGWAGLLEELWYRAKLILHGKPVPGRANNNTVPHPFDVAHGTDTGGLHWGEALKAAGKDGTAYWATGYYGISPSAFHAALERLRLHWPDYTFVDIGCGKGRAMLLASRFPFRAILGIELSANLAGVAQRNIEAFTAPWQQVNTRLTVAVGDATVFPFPVGPMVVFLYHPFAAPVMKLFLAHLQQAAQSASHDIYLLYANPELHAMVAATPGMRWLWKETFELTAEEGAADRFGSYGETFSAYRLSA